ncbi:MAG: bifunctional adenosylcobinamide kinase/adenosylcobinamide-phosphate guanylyltransferase [Bacillota bacterium]
MRPGMILILGGARSGKSRLALDMAHRESGRVLFVATAEPRDPEMRARIEAHRRERPADWHLLETPLRVGQNLAGHLDGVQTVIVDCMSMLVANVLLSGPAVTVAGLEPDAGLEAVRREIGEIVRIPGEHRVCCIVVSNEVGMGIVPDNALARRYRDALGVANQLLAREAEEVFLMVAGIPLLIKTGS